MGEASFELLIAAQFSLCETFDLADIDRKVGTRNARFLISAFQDGPAYFRIWDAKQQTENLESLAASLKKANKLYWSLHPMVRKRLEQEHQQKTTVTVFDSEGNKRPKGEASINGDHLVLNIPTELPADISIKTASYPRENLELGEVLGAISGNPPGSTNCDNPAILRTLNGIKPARSFSHSSGQSTMKLKKSALVDAASIVYQQISGEEAVKGADAGNQFHDFVEDVFLALEINANPKRAIENWGIEIRF